MSGYFCAVSSGFSVGWDGASPVNAWAWARACAFLRLRLALRAAAWRSFRASVSDFRSLFMLSLRPGSNPQTGAIPEATYMLDNA